MWKTQFSTHIIRVDATNVNCAVNGGGSLPDSTATCPAQTYLTGGGYSLALSAPYFSGRWLSSNAPDSSYPNVNGWSVHAGGEPGNSCFLAFALCSY